ncbi:Imm51 family immunity protein [Micromonospora sp. CA-246542]|uniref:Imm51 family immunity protein n=1 Tax=Micromonospora sp. CA-246542 TaxID=3239959 RepID=UPI003D912424
MTLLSLIETTSGQYSLRLEAGTTPVDDLIRQLAHEPNGYFWEGVAQVLVSTEAETLEGRFELDSEAGMFCAYSTDRNALEELATRMNAIVTDGERLRRLVSGAEASGFEFDD